MLDSGHTQAFEAKGSSALWRGHSQDRRKAQPYIFSVHSQATHGGGGYTVTY